MSNDLNEFYASGQSGLLARPGGTTFLHWCPVCGSRRKHAFWRLPLSAADSSIELNGAACHQWPSLKYPFTIYGFDFCNHCNSIFRNPTAFASGKTEPDTSLDQMLESAAWEPYLVRYRDMMSAAPLGAQTLLDAFSGMGQLLFLAQHSGYAWRRLIGIESSVQLADNMRKYGIEGHCADIEHDNCRSFLSPGSVDLAVAFDLFEQTQHPLAVCGRLLDALRVGGRLYLTACRHGEDVDGPIRPSDNIYIGPRLLTLLPSLLPCRVLDVRKQGYKCAIVLERTAGAVTEAHFNLGRQAAVEADDPISTDIPLIGPFERDGGASFRALLSRGSRAQELGALGDKEEARRQSHVAVVEDGRVLGPAHSVHASIREIGLGRFSHWKDTIYFSTSDNSDPNANGRSYSLRMHAV